MSARETRPRRFAHHGTVPARGFWLSRRVLPHTSCERRALDLWRPGTEIRALGADLLLVIPTPQMVSADQSPGTPLVEVDGVLTSAPLTPRERRSLTPPHDVALVAGGTLEGHARAELPSVDAADWLAVEHFELLPASPLGELPAPPEKLPPARTAEALYDEKAGRTSAERARVEELLQGLERARQRRTGGSSPGLVARLFQWLAQRQRLPKSAAPAPTALARRTASPSLWERLSSAAARWIGRTWLMRVLNRKQAEYLRALFEALDRHDDLDVLRRAIPLGGMSGENAAPALLPPRLRSRFEISLGARSTSRLVDFGPHLYAELQRAYESVFERLERAEKHEEAAFFLAEILNAPERGVAYLEKHGRFETAARLAEARALAPGLVVRQWFLAGDRARAVTIAVRDGAFDDAIRRLDRAGQKQEADALRLLQAERLAAAGRLVVAARSVHHVEPARSLVLEWLRRAREAGDSSGAVLELALAPSRFELVRDAIANVLEQGDPDTLRARLALAEDFVKLKPAEGRSVAQLLAREILADAAAHGDRQLATAANRLAHYVSGAFYADFPAIVEFERRTPKAPTHHRYAATDTGTRALHDVVAVGARFVVALGEAGAVLVDGAGRVLAHFDQPAETLVSTSDGLRLLTVARRGDVLRVGRIDLASRRSDHWGEVRASSYARRFDGELWAVAEPDWPHGDGATLNLLDACDERPARLRSVPLHIAPHSDLVLDERHCHLVGSAPFGPLESLEYELPSWTLRRRAEPKLDRPADSAVFCGLFYAGPGEPVLWERWLDTKTGAMSAPRWRRDRTELPLPASAPGLTAKALDNLDAWSAVVGTTATGATVIVGDFKQGRVALELELEGAEACVCRLHPDRAVIVDDTGRLLSFDLMRARCTHDLRL